LALSVSALQINANGLDCAKNQSAWPGSQLRHLTDCAEPQREVKSNQHKHIAGSIWPINVAVFSRRVCLHYEGGAVFA